MRSGRGALVVFGLLGLSASSPAATPGGGGGEPTPTTTYFEQGILIRSGEVVQALGPDLMGDSVNEYSGGLEFTQTDVSLPGNDALQVRVGRHKAVGTTQAYANTGLFGDWDLDIPHLRTIATQREPNWYGGGSSSNLNRCSQIFTPPLTHTASDPPITVGPVTFWDGYHMYIPGEGDQTLLSRSPNNTNVPTDGGLYPIVTKKHFALRCLSALDNGAGEGFEARAPDGTRYQFDHIAVRPYKTLTKPTGGVARVEIWILPTRITDRFGNWVQYTYGSADGWRVSAITSSDGRQITFHYNENGNRVDWVTDGTRTWTYRYAASGTLQYVVQPDASYWTFAIDALNRDPYAAGDPGCDTDDDWSSRPPISGTITHPSGATGTFVLNMTTHGRSAVPGSNCVTAKIGRYFAAWSLTSKTLSGPGMPAMTWQYAYSPAVGSFAPCNGCVSTKTVTITDPLLNVATNTYGTQYGLDEGLLLSAVQAGSDGVALRSTTYGYAPSAGGPYPDFIGSTNHPSDPMSRIFRPQSRRDITQQGVTFTRSESLFDNYARAKSVTRSNTQGSSRSELIDYYDHTNRWILGQVASLTVNALQPNRMEFDPSTALPTKSYRFGKLQAAYEFDSVNGALFKVTDGLNHTTKFTSYKRGLPQRIDYADLNFITAVVNNIGTIASVTNEAKKTWQYEYDAMGRLWKATPPQGDVVVWNTKMVSFVQVNTSEFGLEPGHWRQTITEGNAVTVNYFDARWRKRITTTYDSVNPSGTRRMQRFDYDPYNRTMFASYPARSIDTIAAVVPGTGTTYDALGRPSKSVSDSELGALTTRIEYLTGFQKQVTNPRGFPTKTTYQVFDEPSDAAITSIAAPEGVSVAIVRDIFGKPLSVSRGGNGVTATRSYVYDGYQMLCKTVEPETGATIQSLDAANNVSWRAIGLGLTSTATCDQASVPGNKKIAFAYDARNRVTGTGFGDGSPSIGRSYTPDGLPFTVVSNGSSWVYAYNNRRLLTGESLSFPNGEIWGVSHSYNANGHEAGVTYPDGSNIVLKPNALGEPTQVGGYAVGVSYHPNGSVASYTLGNGVVHTTTQNTRGLTLRNTDAGIVQDRYDYDRNGNVGSITDELQGVSSRALGYDGLDRLKTANSPGVWGSAT
jgi:YD repeat-containing protein